MMKSLTTLLILALFAAPTNAQKLSSAFIDMKEKEFRKQYENLAVMPIHAVEIAFLPEELKPLIMEEVLKYLEKEDFDVLPPEVVTSLESELIDRYGGPVPPSIREIVDQHIKREVLHQHAVDGIVEVTVAVVQAPFSSDKASWSGTKQKIEVSGDGWFGGGKSGNVYASSIHVAVLDRSGTPRYFWSGGVEVMMHREGETMKSLPREALWQDEERIRDAVEYAFKPL